MTDLLEEEPEECGESHDRDILTAQGEAGLDDFIKKFLSIR